MTQFLSMGPAALPGAGSSMWLPGRLHTSCCRAFSFPTHAGQETERLSGSTVFPNAVLIGPPKATRRDLTVARGMECTHWPAKVRAFCPVPGAQSHPLSLANHAPEGAMERRTACGRAPRKPRHAARAAHRPGRCRPLQNPLARGGAGERGPVRPPPSAHVPSDSTSSPGQIKGTDARKHLPTSRQ